MTIADGSTDGIFMLTKAAALAYLMFNLYSPPCVAALSAMRAEMKSAKWFWSGIGLQLAVGYTVSYLVYTLTTLFSGETLNATSATAGGIAVAVMAGIVTMLIVNTNRRLKSEKKLKKA